ncbi:MAG: cupredoxin domain-containing protein [Actinobacteria bacterium]|nr:cupredoxin domain-containing protein [Actinomycetota bacterium]
MRTRLRAASVGLLSVAAVACSSDPTGFAFGEPAAARDADRAIQVTQFDTPGFDPAAIDVEVGETVTFEVTNAGRTTHEFVLGDAAMQDEHADDMGDMAWSMMADEENALTLEPFEKGSLTWTFTEPGTVLYACHVDGHYADGMVGEINVGAG